uniref:Uncharacterized protein n=1 Tax=Anopheles funestus TaxID=62324 RepID=A0A182RYT2_ANOFN
MRVDRLLTVGALLFALVLVCDELPRTEAVRLLYRSLCGDSKYANVLSSPHTPKCRSNESVDLWGYCRQVVKF